MPVCHKIPEKRQSSIFQHYNRCVKRLTTAMQTNEFGKDSQLRTGQPLHELIPIHMNKHYNTTQISSTGFPSNDYSLQGLTALPPVVFCASVHSVLYDRLALVLRALPSHPMYQCKVINTDQYYPLGHDRHDCPCPTKYIRQVNIRKM